jgi:hypothetical protein
MQIKLHFLDEFTEVLEVEPSSTVLALKEQISAALGIPPQQFWLSTEQRILENGETFEGAGVIDAEELWVSGVIERVLPVYQPEPVYHPVAGRDALKQAGLALQADLAALRRLA